VLDRTKTTISPARSFLRTFLSERHDAETRVREATEAETRARQILGSARLRLHKLEAVDEALHAHRVEALKAHALDPSGGPPSMQVPSRFAGDVQERDLARDEMRAAQAAHEQLQRDLMLEKEALRRAEEQVRSATKLVAIEDGEALVAELNQVMRQALALKDELGALAHVVAPGEQWATGRLQLSQTIIDRLQVPLDHRPMLPGTQTYGAGEGSRWRTFLERLQRDADAVR
jgi:hypothetical protein